MQIIEDVEYLFSFSNLQLIINNTNNLPIKKLTLLPTLLPALPVIFSIINDNKNKPLSLITLDNNMPLIRQSAKICHIPNRYGMLAYHIAFSTILQNKICELLSYNKVIYSLEAYLWKYVIDKKVSLLNKNHT